jgi:hypothetical protein
VFFFTSVRLSHNPNLARLPFCERNGHEPPINESESDVSGFAVIFSLISPDEHVAGKHLRDIQKVNAALVKIRLSFRFIPFESHGEIVQTSTTHRPSDPSWANHCLSSLQSTERPLLPSTSQPIISSPFIPPTLAVIRRPCDTVTYDSACLVRTSPIAAPTCTGHQCRNHRS